MKQTLLGFLALLLSWSVSGQIIVTSATFPQVGDTLETAIDNMPTGINIGTTGGPFEWDFTNLQAPFSSSVIYKNPASGTGSGNFPTADLLVEILGESETYFNVTGNEVQLLGTYGSDPVNFGLTLLIDFEPALIERRAPLSFIDQHISNANVLVPFSADDIPGGILDSLILAPDSIRIRIGIDRTDLVDAYGTLQIPGGSFEVLRQKRTEMRETLVEAKFAIGGWVDVTDFIPGADDLLGEQTVESYFFWSDEAKEPIAIVTMDESNTMPTRVEYKAIDFVSSVSKTVRSNPSMFAYPNPAFEEVRFDFSNIPPGNYQLNIINILGVRVYHQSLWINGNRTVKVNLADFRKGTYLYSLVGKDDLTLATKRLIVLRP